MPTPFSLVEPPCTLVLLTGCRRRSLPLLLPPSRSRSLLLQRGNTQSGSEDPSWPLFPLSSRCGSPSRSTTSLAPPLCTGSASKHLVFFYCIYIDKLSQCIFYLVRGFMYLNIYVILLGHQLAIVLKLILMLLIHANNTKIRNKRCKFIQYSFTIVLLSKEVSRICLDVSYFCLQPVTLASLSAGGNSTQSQNVVLFISQQRIRIYKSRKYIRIRHKRHQ